MMTSENAMTDGAIPPIKETIGTPGWRARRRTSHYLGQSIRLVAIGLFAVAALAALYQGGMMATKRLR